MTNSFRKLMRNQVQDSLNNFLGLLNKPIPKKGWIRAIRDSLGMSSSALSKRLGCSTANILALEGREKKGSISLATLERAAQAMNCKLVYSIVPIKPLDQILEDQAKIIAKKQAALIKHSMRLEHQGLTAMQLKKQEEDLVQALLQGNPKKLWDNDAI